MWSSRRAGRDVALTSVCLAGPSAESSLSAVSAFVRRVLFCFPPRRRRHARMKHIPRAKRMVGRGHEAFSLSLRLFSHHEAFLPAAAGPWSRGLLARSLVVVSAPPPPPPPKPVRAVNARPPPPPPRTAPPHPVIVRTPYYPRSAHPHTRMHGQIESVA